MWEDFKIEGNIFYSSHKDSELGWEIPKDGYRMINPELVEGNGLGQLTPQSPAVDKAIGEYPSVNQDIHGRQRNGPKDIGAQELSTSSNSHAPLSPVEVGPNAK